LKKKKIKSESKKELKKEEKRKSELLF